MTITTRAAMNVPLLDLKAQYADLKTDIDDAVRRVMESTRFIGGPEITGLEDEVARYSQCSHAVDRSGRAFPHSGQRPRAAALVS